MTIFHFFKLRLFECGFYLFYFFLSRLSIDDAITCVEIIYPVHRIHVVLEYTDPVSASALAPYEIPDYDPRSFRTI